MQSLLLERSLGKLTPWQFERVITESLYYNLDALDQPKFPLKKQAFSINSLDFDKSEGRYLLCGSADSSIKVFDSSGAENRAKLIGNIDKSNGGHSFGVTMVQWWPLDTGMFLSGSYDNTLKAWDSNSLEEAFSFGMDSQVNCFDTNPTGQNSLIAACCDSSHVRLLDLNTTSAVHSLTGHNGTVLSCRWSPNDSFILATGSSAGEVRIWDIRRTDSCLTQLDMHRADKEAESQLYNRSRKVGIVKSDVNAHSHGVNGLCWTENGKTLITTGHDEKIRVWDLDDKTGVNTLLNFGPFVKNKFSSYKSILLSPIRETEVQYIWYPSDSGEILVFRLQDGKLVAKLRRNLQENSRSCCIAYPGDSAATYYSGTVDGKINVWGPKDEELMVS